MPWVADSGRGRLSCAGFARYWVEVGAYGYLRRRLRPSPAIDLGTLRDSSSCRSCCLPSPLVCSRTYLRPCDAVKSTPHYLIMEHNHQPPLERSASAKRPYLYVRTLFQPSRRSSRPVFFALVQHLHQSRARSIVFRLFDHTWPRITRTLRELASEMWATLALRYTTSRWRYVPVLSCSWRAY